MNNVNLLYEVEELKQSEGLGIVRDRNREGSERGGKGKGRQRKGEAELWES